MPNKQTFGQLFVPSVEGDLILGYMQSQTGFVARKACPVSLVGQQAGKYPVMDREDWRRVYAGKRAPGQPYNRASFGSSFASYACQETGIELPRPDEHNAAAAFNLATIDAQFLAEQIAMSEELDFANAFLGTGKWANDVTPSTKWDNSGNPISDMRSWMRTFRDECGYMPDALVMDRFALDTLIDNSGILGRFQYTETGVLTTAHIGAMLGIAANRIFVMEGVYETTQEGATSLEDDLHGQGAKGWMLFLRNGTSDTVDQNTPTAMKCFAWDAFDRGMPNVGYSSYRDEERRQSIHRANDYVDFAITSTSAGLFAHTLLT